MDERDDSGLERMTAAWENDGLLRAGTSLGVDGAESDWAVPWSDLMMVMFVLFAVLFADQLARHDREASDRRTEAAAAAPRPVERPEAPQPAPAELHGRNPEPTSLVTQSEQAVRETDLQNVDVELQADRSVRVSVRGPMFFDLGEAELKPQTQRFLERIAAVIDRTDYEVDIVGHTDSFPVSNEHYATNWELSAMRATAVARYLIDRGGLDPARFTVMGRSMYRPAAPNTSPENQAMNRRVEIIITRRSYVPALRPEA